MTTASPASRKQRRRVDVAHLIHKRVSGQRNRFATAYGKAQTAQERFSVTADALRAAAAPGRHQPDPDSVDRLLDRLTDLMKHELNALHDAQYASAAKTLRADERRIERNERRLASDARTRHHPA